MSVVSDPGPLIALGVLAVFPVVFAVFWSVVCTVLGLASGWQGLAGRFRAPGPAPRPVATAHFIYGMLGLVAYRGVLNLDGSAAGLGLSVMVLFRPGHPPLRVPWAQVEALPTEKALLRGLLQPLRLGGPRGPVLRVPRGAWDAVVRARPAAGEEGGVAGETLVSPAPNP
jgi:hypothetical protein